MRGLLTPGNDDARTRRVHPSVSVLTPAERSVRAHANQLRWSTQNPARRLAHQSRTTARKLGYAPAGGWDIDAAEIAIAAWMAHKPAACECCGKPGPVLLDHNHQTGQIRAWLCAWCNRLEGEIANGRVARIQSFLASRET